ncbi:MAG: hypothetical protein AB1Z98_12545 [Nannocystaceae bacterium]
MSCQPGTSGTGDEPTEGTDDSTTQSPVGSSDTAVDTTQGEASASGDSGATSSSGGSSTTAASGSESSGTATGCVPGQEEGCACDEGECGVGLACEDEVCVPSDCGNGMVDAGEECDDMNAVDSDGCDNDCTISAGAAAVVAGDEHVCALLHTGEIKCWGNHTSGRLGYPGLGEDLGDTEVPADFGVVDVGAPVEQMALGGNFTCMLLAGDGVVCWGDGQHGRLGQGSEDDLGIAEAPSAIPLVSLSGTPIQIAAGAEHACAVFASGDLSCWGRNDHGQVGVPGFAAVGDDELPSDVPNVIVGPNVLPGAAGPHHTCALLGGGDVRCWGRNDVGQLGDPTSTADIGDNEDPATAPLVLLSGEAVLIAARFDHTCVAYATGEIQCWGDGASGKLGYGDTNVVGDDEDVGTLPAIDLGFDPSHFGMGEDHTCVRLDPALTMRCWGEGDNGRLGYGNTMDLFAPGMDPVDLSTPAGPASVTAGREFSCSRTAGSQLKCWGRNNRGQLGLGAVFMTDLGDDEALSVVGPIQLE